MGRSRHLHHGATDEQGRDYNPNEIPIHTVNLSSFYIGQTEVTQALWRAVMGNNPSYHQGNDFPVENVSWNDCQKFIKALNSLTGKTFRLPTEAEWEYAARGGSRSLGFKYSGSSNNIGSVAWYVGNSKEQTRTVEFKISNELGLYDMSGNVWEWCQDWYGIYSSSDQTNPTGSETGDYRVIRGGSKYDLPLYFRVASRKFSSPDYRDHNIGLRLAL